MEVVRCYERIHDKTIKDFHFKPGDLVLVRNTTVEKSLNTKMSPRYLGPMVVVWRTKGGSYLCCEMNGAMFHSKIAQFRVVPYLARKRLDLSEKILDLIDLNKESLEDLVAEQEEPDKFAGKDLQFHRVKLRPDWQEIDPDELSDEFEESEVSEEEKDQEPTPVYDTKSPRRSRRARK